MIKEQKRKGPMEDFIKNAEKILLSKLTNLCRTFHLFVAHLSLGRQEPLLKSTITIFIVIERDSPARF
jgi:hypothetical protein